jgi:hypothetical protein
MDAGEPRPNGSAINLEEQSGRDTVCRFRAAGVASSLFPDAPHANAGFDVSFQNADSWLLAVIGRQLSVLDQVDRFRQPILAAYKRGVWKADWALVTGVASVERMTLLASSSASSKVALSVGATVTATTPLEAALTSDVSISAMNQQIIKCMITQQSGAFCTAIRVKDSWFKSPEVGDLSLAGKHRDPTAAGHDAFWEDVDDVSKR